MNNSLVKFSITYQESNDAKKDLKLFENCCSYLPSYHKNKSTRSLEMTNVVTHGPKRVVNIYIRNLVG